MDPICYNYLMFRILPALAIGALIGVGFILDHYFPMQYERK